MGCGHGIWKAWSAINLRVSRKLMTLGSTDFQKTLKISFNKGCGHQISKRWSLIDTNYFQTNSKATDDVITAKSHDSWETHITPFQ